MPRVTVVGEEIDVGLSWWEKAAARRRTVRVPLAALREVHVEPEWWRALRGTSGRGLWIPGVRYVGVRSLPDGGDFVAVKPDGPVLCVELRPGAPFRRLALSVPFPEQAVHELQPFVPEGRW